MSLKNFTYIDRSKGKRLEGNMPKISIIQNHLLSAVAGIVI